MKKKAILEDWPEDDPEEIEELTEEDMDEEVTVISRLRNSF